MKHLKIFKTESERAAYIAETPLPTYPYVHYVEETKGVEYSGAEVDIPFYFESIEGLSVKFSNKYQYSRDGVSWSDGTSSTTITFNTGERVYFRATGLTASSSSGIGKFTISTGTAKIGGNLMSMLYGEDYRGKTTIEQPYAFQSLFQGCSRLKSAKRLALPATTLVTYCYSSMFRGCTSLVNAPALPATTLTNYCYSGMFYGCTSLVNAPELPATTLAERCYSNMFYGCTSLVNAPALPATTLSGYCYEYMFWGCTSLVNAPALPATTLVTYCYSSMFRG